jgi:2-polyprenyl-6-methoxyphenol hydroxylase-like FAD-dependent oxidoreductase
MTADSVLSRAVLIVGGGPVGLTLAIDLGRRGIPCVLVERNIVASPLPKMELCNPRTMEIFRRLGIVEQVRAAGWPFEASMDVVVGPSLVDAPYLVLPYPSPAEQQRQIARTTDASQPREAYHRISQYTLEPLLREIAETIPCVTVLFGHTLESFEADEYKVRASIKTSDGSTVSIDSQYLVGCDGGNSAVRRQLGIEYHGDHAVARHLMIYFRAPDLLAKTGAQLARHYYIAGRRQAALVTQDDLKRWALHIVVPADVDVNALDPRAELTAALGMEIEAELIHVGAWSAHLVVANRYRHGRVFLAGDSAHQYIPTGGFGMNTGIGDADNLGWKLAATLQGWGGTALLDSYEEERLPVGRRNRDKSRFAAEGSMEWRQKFSPDVLQASSEGLEKRGTLIRAIDSGQRRSHEMRGVEMGYRYTSSSVCMTEPEGAVGADEPVYTPSATPGARLPHVWVEPGVSVHDQVGSSSVTLLSLAGDELVVNIFEEAARRKDIPLHVVRLPARLREFYGSSLLLLRPDLHVAWRGDTCISPQQVLLTSLGHRTDPQEIEEVGGTRLQRDSNGQALKDKV